MTRGYEDIEGVGGGGLRKFLDTLKGGSEKIVGLGGEAPKICLLQNQQERGKGAPKKLNRQRGEQLKFQASSFIIFILSCHIK